MAEPAEPNLSQPGWDFSRKDVLAILWALGVIGIATYQQIRTYRWKKTLGIDEINGAGIYELSGIATPFVVGVLWPQIYLPSEIPEEQRRHVLLHEETHVRRKDYLVKWLAFAVAGLHWFNPLAWLAYYLMSMDMEMSCDESVLAQLEDHSKKGYAETLLTFAEKSASGGLAFGQPYAMKRIRNVLSYRPITYRMTIVLTVICVALAGCFLTDPTDHKEDPSGAEDEDVILIQPEEETTQAPEINTWEDEPASESEDLAELYWNDQYMASQESYEVGSTSPMISRSSCSWLVDLNHDGVMEQLVFDYRFLEIPGNGIFAVLDDQGRVVYSDAIGNSHPGWRSYYLCERDGKQYLLLYDPYMMQNHAGYTYTLMEMNAQNEIVVAESQNLQFKLGELEYLLYWFPDLVMDIPAMVEFADGLNTLMETSWLLCTTDQDWMGEELYEAGTNYLIGSETNHYRRYETFSQFTGLSKKSRFADLGRALKEAFDSASIPYIPPVQTGNGETGMSVEGSYEGLGKIF